MRYKSYKGLKTFCRTTLIIRQSLIQKVTRASAPEETPAVQPSVALPVFLTGRVVVPRTMLYNLRHTKPKKKEMKEKHSQKLGGLHALKPY
jgi:hypothetical protein